MLVSIYPIVTDGERLWFYRRLESLQTSPRHIPSTHNISGKKYMFYNEQASNCRVLYLLYSDTSTLGDEDKVLEYVYI